MSPDQVLIVSGSQQALDLLGKVLIDKDSKILVEDPSYLGALQSFSLYQPKYVPVPTDDGGLIPEAITPELASGARFLYALPNFQNPTGRTLSLERRIALVKRAAELNLTIIEDDPYGELRYAGEPQPGLLTLAAEYGANVIRLGTFSKVLAPACAWASSPPRAIINKLVQAKQATDLHTPTLTQMAVYEIVRTVSWKSTCPTCARSTARRAAACWTPSRRNSRPASAGPTGRRHVHLGHAARAHGQRQAAGKGHRPERGLRAGRAVLQRRRPCQHPAPELRHGAGRQDPHGHRHPRQASEEAV